MIVFLKSNENVGCDVWQVIDLFERFTENIEADPNAHMLVHKNRVIENLKLILAKDKAMNVCDYHYEQMVDKIKKSKKITIEVVAENIQSHCTQRNDKKEPLKSLNLKQRNIMLQIMEIIYLIH